ncbi:MAG: hypothetical protein MJZ26_02610 [Fibrobacter sp.]|nr:hypothetical protein [Fibrobacter sp.]
MKNLKMLFCIVVFSVIGFLGCDDSASSNEPDENASVDSSSSVCKDCDDESSSSAKKIDSSAEKNVESSDDAETGTSSSSKGRVISSSSEYTTLSNASSSNDNALETCSEEFEGMVRIRKDSSGTQLKWDCTDGFWILRSSSSAASSSSYFDTTKVFNPNVEYGSHTDSRDGKVYRTIEINNGFIPFTFFAENLNYGKMIEAGKNQSDSTKYCYNNDSWYCEHGFGGLYTWSNAMGFPSACDSVSVGSDKCPSDFTYPLSGNSDSALYVYHQGVCDEGWHIMNAGEWGQITKFSQSLAAVITSEIWVPGRENRYGVSLLPASKWSSKDGFAPIAPINKQDEMSTSFWYPWQGDYNWAHGPTVYTSQDNTGKLNGILKTDAVSVRCVKDYNIFDYVTWLSQE